MPSPALLEWCSTSFSSLQHSVGQMINCLTKPNVEVPPQVLEIQGLNGQTPGEKWKSFNAIVNTIVENVKNGSELKSELSRISPSLANLLRVHIGIKLRNNDFVLEALKSEDVSVVNKALSARWFFDGGNPNVNVEYFTKEILPFVSVRTRLTIVKRLARGLRGHEEKARQCFVAFVDLYDAQENLSILCACSESFIFDAILRYKLVLPLKTLRALYSKFPDLVVYYLQLGNEKNTDNADDRKVHEIHINEYDIFLPELIRRYPQDFVALYELTPEKNLGTLSVHRSVLLLKNVKDAMIQKSDIFSKLLQPKVVRKRLTAEEMESMFENYLPKDITDFMLDATLRFVEDHLGNEKMQVLISAFEKKYNKSLLEHARKLIESDKGHTSSVLKLLRKLPPTEREIQVKLLLSNTDEGSAMKNVYKSYLKPSDSFPYFKEKISKSTSTEERMQLLGLMVVSCGVHNSKKDLLSVLQYYKERHKNEPNLYVFFEHLNNEFDLKALDDAHWTHLRDIINNAHIRKELLVERVTLIETILEAALRHVMTSKKKNDRHVDVVVDVIVESKIEHSWSTWNVLQDNLALEKDCLERFFLLIPVKYPESHSVWKSKNDRLVTALNLIKSIESYNTRSAATKPSTKKDAKAPQPINLRDYPWIMKLAEEFFARSETGVRKEKLRRLLKKLDPDFYETKMNERVTARDIASGEALHVLRHQPRKVADNWLDYLNEARDKLREGKRASDRTRESLRARTFVAATRWHSELPVKFIETCLKEIRVGGSLAVLGILLPGGTFEKLAAGFVPREAEIRPNEKNAKENFEMVRAVVRAMKFTNPAVSLESLQAFCRGDYLSIADGTLTSVARRASVGSALELAKRLASQPQASAMKRGVRLARLVTTKRQFREILAQTWSGTTSVSMRKLLAKMIFDAFVGTPSADNWRLMRTCLRGLTVDDREAVGDLNEIEKVGAEFRSDYVEEYLNKVEELFAASLDFDWRRKAVCLLVESFDEKIASDVSEEVCLKILKKYFFDADCSEISRATRLFAVRFYLLPAGEKFKVRLNAIVSILAKTVESFDVPHAKKRRYYPANYTVQEFFGDLLNELCASDSDKKPQIVESLLGLFGSSLSPWQEPSSYVALSLYREYLLSESPRDFGMRAARRIGGLVEDFSSNEPIADIADCLNDFVFNKIFRARKNPFSLKLSLIEGLLQGDEHYGALATTKLLDPREVAEYDERYDRFIGSLRQMKNSCVQYHLYQHLNHLTDK